MQESFKIPTASFPSVSGAVCSFDSQYAGLPLKSHTVAVTGYQSGSGTPSPSNPRALNGWTSANIYHTNENINIFTYTSEDTQGVARTVNADKSISLSGTSTAFIGRFLGTAYLKKGTTYYLSGGISNRIYIAFYTVDLGVFAQDTGSGASYTPTEDMLVNTYMAITGNTNCNDKVIYPMFSLSSGAEYVTPVGTTATINFGSTIYGGNYDAISGVLTKTHDLMSGSYFINPQNNNDGTGTVCFILASNTPFKPPVNYCMCNILQSSNENWNALPANSYSISNNTYIVVCSDTPNQTRSQFIDWFDNNVQMCLELQSSTTIQLPPVRVETLEGVVNNIWADTGDTTLQYIKLG